MKATYAIIQVNGKQYRVEPDQVFTVALQDKKEKETFDVSDVMLVSDGTETVIGAPLVDKAKVTLEVISQDRDAKIRVATYKAKSRYRRVKGHRQDLTTVKVSKITA